MANSAFSFTAYGQVGVFDAKNGGYQLKGNGFANPSYQNLAVAGTRVIALSPAVVFGTAFGPVTANSIVEVYPTGLFLPATSPTRYICSDLFSTLVSART